MDTRESTTTDGWILLGLGGSGVLPGAGIGFEVSKAEDGNVGGFFRLLTMPGIFNRAGLGPDMVLQISRDQSDFRRNSPEPERVPSWIASNVSDCSSDFPGNRDGIALQCTATFIECGSTNIKELRHRIE